MYEYTIKEVIKVVDGDTLDILLDLGFDVQIKQRVRINRVDTPESVSKDPLERQLAADAKNFLISWLKDKKNIKIKTIKDDKYGRILGDIYSESGECINDLLISDGYAWPYVGGTKTKNLQILLEQRKAKRQA